MKCAIMQPYFLPYIGYWQLMAGADVFVVLDDVNFISRGYINRNSLLVNGRANLFSIPLEKASQNRLIKDISLKFADREREKFLKTIQAAYAKAPFFVDVYPVMEAIVRHESENLVYYIEHSFKRVNEYLGVSVRLLRSSSLEKPAHLTAQSRIIAICQALDAATYINPIGGRELYSGADFRAAGLALKFLQAASPRYRQFTDDFVPNLSIVDVLMFNGVQQARLFLKEGTLHEPD